MVCAFPTCVLEREPGQTVCRHHAHASTAKQLALGPDSNGLNAVRCGKCRRAFKDDDYVERTPIKVKTRKGPTSKWIHVACSPTAPRPSRKQIRESDKPLFTPGGFAAPAAAGTRESK